MHTFQIMVKAKIIGLGKRLAKYFLGEEHIPDVQQHETLAANELEQQILVH